MADRIHLTNGRVHGGRDRPDRTWSALDPHRQSPSAGYAAPIPRGEHRGMVIALLALLGVDLIVIVALLVVVASRRRWVARQPGAFKGALRVVDGEVPGLGVKWRRGSGRWVRDALVWTRAPLQFRNELVAIDELAGEARAAEPGEVKRVGRDPWIVPLVADGGARVEVASAADSRERALGPLVVWRGRGVGG
jgi:hypothetical protein